MQTGIYNSSCKDSFKQTENKQIGGRKMESKKAKLLLWLPRVLALIFAVVLVVFSRDVIVSGANFKDIAVDLFYA